VLIEHLWCKMSLCISKCSLETSQCRPLLIVVFFGKVWGRHPAKEAVRTGTVFRDAGGKRDGFSGRPLVIDTNREYGGKRDGFSGRPCFKGLVSYWNRDGFSGRPLSLDIVCCLCTLKKNLSLLTPLTPCRRGGSILTPRVSCIFERSLMRLAKICKVALKKVS
jgi:hypothetical protein